MRFIGDYSAKADAKGRVFLPAPMRKVLETEGETACILCKDLFQPCLVLYPESLWNDMLDMLRARLNRWNRQHQDILRRYVSAADKVEPDSNGRILINRQKLDYAGIDADVRFLAVDDHIEIWDKQRAEEILMQDVDLGEQLQDIMTDLPGELS